MAEDGQPRGRGAQSPRGRMSVRPSWHSPTCAYCTSLGIGRSVRSGLTRRRRCCCDLCLRGSSWELECVSTSTVYHDTHSIASSELTSYSKTRRGATASKRDPPHPAPAGVVHCTVLYNCNAVYMYDRTLTSRTSSGGRQPIGRADVLRLQPASDSHLLLSRQRSFGPYLDCRAKLVRISSN